MNIETEKLYLIEQLIKVRDAAILRQLKEILDNESESIVGYGVNGEPITAEKFVNRVQEAEKRIAAGDFTSQEDVEREAENW